MSRGDGNKQDDEDDNKSTTQNSNSRTSRKSTGSRNSVTSRNSSVANSTQQFCVDDKLIIDPKLLSVRTKIGEGAHGKVYEGKYNDQVVAVKVLNGGSTPEEKATLEGRFAREIAMMSRVKHDNLVKFIGACKDPYMIIITELLPGMSLRKFLISVRPNQLDQRVAIGYALDIARAMECLHANGIIHRDLKPDNLLLTENQKSVKLADFGLAREESVTEMMTAETGTYRWMAPEQMRPSLPEHIPADLAFIIQSCWVEDPNVRPSFSQIIRMLNEFLFTLLPPPVPSPNPNTSKASISSNRIITEASVRARGKFSFIRQLFAAKRTRNVH